MMQQTTSLSTNAKPLVLCILDGWGIAAPGPFNAISNSQTPHWDLLQATALTTSLACSGEAVGLPAGQMGNSEVGHMAIGCGRVLLQDLPRIDHAIASGELAQNNLIQQAKAAGQPVHLAGMLSDGGVHSHIAHILALIAILAPLPIYLHLFLDGRDTAPNSARQFLTMLQNCLTQYPQAQIASIGGRFYAMDRDQRYARTELMYAAMVGGEHGGARVVAQWEEAFVDSKGNDLSDEFVEPVVLQGYAGVQAGQTLLFANFRADRVRQLLAALVMPDFIGFARGNAPKWGMALSMMSYAEYFAPYVQPLFAQENVKASLGELLASHGLRQLRVAETEKYAHVTFFFSGGREQPFAGEERVLIPSPAVRTYDEQPAMSAEAITDKVVAAITAHSHEVIIINYANADMVGHSGNFAATCQAVEAIDQCLGRVMAAIEAQGGVLLVTADHGNAEQMIDNAGEHPHTAHTLNLVPLVIKAASYPQTDYRLQEGGLIDIAPTILAILGMEQPLVMGGKNLLHKVG